MDEVRRRILGRRSVRARIALACAGLFLLTGAGFVAVTYTLVDHSLSSAPLTNQVKTPPRLIPICKNAERDGQLTGALAAECKKVFASAAQFGADSQRSHDLHELLLWSVVGLAIATLVAGGLGWVIGRRILLPLQKVTGAARRASQEHLDERIRLDGPHDELRQLADTFDDMLDRLDHAFASQRRFVANASHELRTPLTSMRTLIDVAMAKKARNAEQLEIVLGRVREVLDQSEAIIDGLLTLARSDRGLTTLDSLDLEAAAQDAIDQIATEARASGIDIDAELSPAPLLGDRVLVERLAANLVDNATRYNITGGSINVKTGIEDGQSFLSVTNTGPVVPGSKLASLFEPFTRLDQRVNGGQGVGLGLSIVASVVASHNGQINAEALSGGGMEITVRFPGRSRPWRSSEPDVVEPAL
ncbi:MAG: HAMP domain-containing protein [Acidimicrobiaceae bacterium]|nr:HAMP domain-containing protein [Acidimicrobiaceae bacterium]